MKYRKFPLVLLLILSMIGNAFSFPTGFLREILGEAAKIGDDVVLKNADDFGKQIAKNKKIVQSADEIRVSLKQASKMRTALKAGLTRADASLLKKIDKLNPDELAIAMIVKKGGQSLQRSAPDILARGRLLKEGGADLITSAGQNGDAFVRQAVLMDSLVSVGSLPKMLGTKPTVKRFSEVMNSDGAWLFFKKYMVPHKKKWIAGGILVAYLAEPEIFHDAAGKITEEGARRVSQMTGVIIASGVKGAGEGGQVAAKNIWASFYSSYLTGKWAWASWLGLALFLYVIGLIIPRTRKLLLHPLCFLMTKSSAD